MELMTIDALLTLVPQHATGGLRAWAEAALGATARAEQTGQPLWRVLPQMLPEAGWEVEASSQQSVSLSQLSPLLQLDATLCGLLDRRGAVALPEPAARLLDRWWQRAGPCGDGQSLVALVGTLQAEPADAPRARLYTLHLPSPGWQWLARPHLVQVRVQRLHLRLDAARAASAMPLARQAGARMEQVQSVLLDTRTREAPTTAWLMA